MNVIVNDFLVKADNVCDYIPVVSTVSNLIDLFQKYIILSVVDEQAIAENYYYTYLKEKNALYCFILLIPIIGNIIIKIFEHMEYNAIKQNGLNLEFASEKLKNNKDVVLAAVAQNGWAFEFASEKLKNDKDVALAAVTQNGDVLGSLVLKKIKLEEVVVHAAFQQWGAKKPCYKTVSV